MSSQMIIAVVVVLLIVAAMVYRKKHGKHAEEEEHPAVGAARREKRIENELKKLNRFKNSARVIMKPGRFKYEITMRVRKLERELGIKIVESSILAEGDIVLDYA